MNNDLRHVIDLVFDDYQRFWGMGPNPVASEDAIADVAVWVQRAKGVPVPQELVDFWRVTDGIELNGTVFWATRSREANRMTDIVENNTAFGQMGEGLLVVGESDDVWIYVQECATGRWQTRAFDDPTWVEKNHASFDEMVESCLRAVVGGGN